MNAPPATRLSAVAAVLGLLLATCTGGAEPAQTISPRPPPATSERALPTVVLGAEGWAECMNPITGCAFERWAWYTVFQHVLPRGMQLDAAGNYVASPLLTQAPSLSNGGLRPGAPFTVAFHIRSQAVWDDGSPITSRDFEFTWRAILFTPGSMEADRYRGIRSIDTTDPKTAIVEFRYVTAQWPDFFGGSRGFILKRAAFPNADPRRPGLQNEMAASIRFSGGPWILRHWSRRQAVLARNERYYGRKAALDRVVFVPRQGQALRASLLAGEVDAIYSTPPFDPSVAPSLLRALAATPSVKAVGASGTEFSALWLNAKLPPLNDRRVREALLHAIDRQAIVDRIVKIEDPRAEVLNCGFISLPNLGPWCANKPFEPFTYDPATARGLLESAGYDCSTTPCMKSGKPLRVRYATSPISTLQQLTQGLVKSRAAEAGFDVEIVGVEVGGLGFGPPCPMSRTIAVIQCGREARPDGSVTEVLGCAAIPVKKRDFVGENRIGWCNPEGDRWMRESDRELDPARRLQLLSAIHEIEADDLMGLPLFVVPAVSAWRTDQIAGPIGRFASSPYGLFFDMNEWHPPA